MENLNISREELVLNDLGGVKWLHITKPYAQANNRKAILQLLDLIIVSAILIFLSLSVWQQNSAILTAVGYLSWIGIGFLTARWFIVQHDAGHGSFFSSNLANDIIGVLCGFLTCMPYHYWKAEHAFHHGNVGVLETIAIGDIKTRTVEEYNNMNRWQKLRYTLWRNPIVLFFVVGIVYIIIYLRLPFTAEKSVRKYMWTAYIETLLHIVFYGTLTYFIGKWFFIFTIVRIYVFSITAFWFFYIQHQYEDTYKYWGSKKKYRKAEMNLITSILGSAYYKVPWIVNYLTGNIAYHHIHHLNTKIPNYNLKECFEKEEILNKYVITIEFWSSFVTKYVLWSEDLKKMVTFAHARELARAS